MKKSSKSFERNSVEMDMPRKDIAEALILETIDNCRKDIRARNFDSAKRAYNQLRMDFMKLTVADDKKDKIRNEIRMIYDDINVGMLSR